MITKYGYIARTKGTWGYFGDIPSKAFIISEGMRYPNIFCIEPDRAKRFVDAFNAKIITEVNLSQWISSCLFGGGLYNDIVKSFDGNHPEIELLDPPSVSQVFNRTPENLRVKLRVMLDENGKQIRQIDFPKGGLDQRLTAKQLHDKQITKIVCDPKLVDYWAFDSSTGILYVSPDHEKAAIEIANYKKTGIPANEYIMISAEAVSLQPPSQREQMIAHLVESERSSALDRISEYEYRVRQWDDEKLAREYRMEFGESLKQTKG